MREYVDQFAYDKDTKVRVYKDYFACDKDTKVVIYTNQSSSIEDLHGFTLLLTNLQTLKCVITDMTDEFSRVPGQTDNLDYITCLRYTILVWNPRCIKEISLLVRLPCWPGGDAASCRAGDNGITPHWGLE